MDIGGTLMRGHPTLASQLPILGIGAGFAVNQSLASRSAWFIDPINGRNTNSGTTLGTAIQTRSEFARRMWGVSLTQNITVTITSSLLAGDDIQPLIFGSVGSGWAVNYVGVPVVAFTGVITGYVNRNAAANTVAQMTIAGLPVSWTASGLVTHIVEWTDGVGAFIRAVVVSDLGARTAWVSPPLNQLSQTTNFVNGTTVNVYTMPNIRVPVIVGNFNTFSYLDATFWNCEYGSTRLLYCTGPWRQFAGGLNLVNCSNVTIGVSSTFEPGISVDGQVVISGGYHGLNAASGAAINVLNSCTLYRINVEGGGEFTTSGNNAVFADIEFNGFLNTVIDSLINPDGIQSGQLVFGAFVYGSSTTSQLVRFTGQNSRVVFAARLPTVTGATGVNFVVAGYTELASRLSTVQLNDSFGNEVVGPMGPQMTVDRYSLTTQARGLIAETLDGRNSSATGPMIGGVVSYVAVGLRAGDIVTNIGFFVATAGTVMTLSKVGLYDKLGNRLALSADQGASWATAGYKRIAMIAPFTILATDIYYLAAVSAFTVAPQIPRGAQNAGLGSFIEPGLPANYYGQAGQVDLPVAAVFAAGVVAGTFCWYMNVS